MVINDNLKKCPNYSTMNLIIKSVKDKGQNYMTKNKYKFNATKIQIIGPTSMTENTLTNKEAYILYKKLKEYFQSNYHISDIKEIW